MKSIKKVVSMSLVLLICNPLVIGYADNSEIIGEQIVVKQEKPSIIKLTLSEAIEQAMEKNSEVEKSRLELEKAEVDFREGNYDIRANKNLLDDESETSLNYIKMVTLLEFTNKNSLENAKRKDKVVRNNIKNEVEELYFNLVQAKNMVDINKSSVDLNKRLSEIAQIKLDLGLGIKQEVLNSKLNYTKAKESYDQSVKNLDNAKMFFSIKLGLDTLQKVELLDKIEYKKFSIADILVEEKSQDDDKYDKDKKVEEQVELLEKEDELELAINQALKNRNEIKLLEFACELESLKMDIIRYEYPSITFMYRKQEAELEKAKENLENAKNNIAMEIRSAYKEIGQKKIEINSAKNTAELASEALRIAKVNYELGISVPLDVENAEITLKQANLGLSNAVLKYNLETLNFKTITQLGKS